MAPLGPYKLVTVNNAPERAQRLVGRVVEDVKDRYTIIHAGNAERMQNIPILRTQSCHSLNMSIRRSVVFTG